MRFLPFVPLLSIVVPFAAMAQTAAPTARPLAGALPPLAGAVPPPPAHAVLQRLFIAPSGEPFRAPADAPYPLATWFAQADHNHDGRVDLTEFTWDFDRFFDALDTDHDGTLRSDEIERYERMVPELHSGFAEGPRSGGGHSGGGKHRGGHGGGRGGGGMGGGMGGGGMGGAGGYGGGGGGGGGYHGDDGGAAQDGGQEQEQSSDDTPHAPPAYVPSGSATRYELISIPEPVSAMDTDLSGTVTREELHRAAARRFGILDQKQRGYLTLDDLPEPDAARHKEATKYRGHGPKRLGGPNPAGE